MVEIQEHALSMKNTMMELQTRIQNCIPPATQRLEVFAKGFDKRFPVSKDGDKRAFAETILWSLMSGPVVLYALEMNGASLVDLHSIVERLSLARTPRLLFRDDKAEAAKTLLERKNLPELANVLHKCGIISHEELTWAKSITKIRNGYAHKNTKLIEKATNPGRSIAIFDIDAELRGVDCVYHILSGIQFLYKIFDGEESRTPVQKG